MLAPCRKHTSVIAGTVMQGTHLPIRKWFLAAYLMATHSNSISALQFQPKLGVSYKTAWLLLHKLRRAMVNPERTPLSGTIDVDETAVPYRRKEDALKRGGGSSKANQLWIAAAVETLGKHVVGRIRIARIADRSAASIVPFVEANTASRSRLRTDSLASYNTVPDRRLRKVNLKKRKLQAHVILLHQGVVTARGCHFERTPRAFLSLDVGEVGQVARRHMHARLGARQHLRAAEMVGGGDQAARHQYVDVGSRPGRLGTAGTRADQALAFRTGADCRRQGSSHRCGRAVERQFPSRT